MSNVTEQELIEKAKAPRVTKEQLLANIIKETYFSADYQQGTDAPHDPNLALLTICILTLKNGFTVLGQSACADPTNFDPEIGRRLARSDAENKILPLMGYELKTKVVMVAEASQPTLSTMSTYVGAKVVHAVPMNRRDYNTFRAWDLPKDEDGNDEGYLVEYGDGGEPNVKGYTGYLSWSPKDVFERAYHTL